MNIFAHLRGNIGGGQSRAVRVDTSTHALKVITYPHSEIHDGSHYFYDSHHDIAKAGVLNHLIVTPDTAKWANMEAAVGSTAGQVIVELFEGATVSALGDLETARNRNRNFPDASTTLVYETPTVTTTGELIDSSVYGAAKVQGEGGGDRGNNEIILKQNTIYLFRVTERNVLATTVNINLDWYEHTRKK
jgi:hypothetical protein